MSTRNPLLALMDVARKHGHSARLADNPALIYLPDETATRAYYGLVTDPDADGNAMCGDLPVRFVVRARVPAQRGAIS